MSKIITDKQKIEEVLTKGISKVIPGKKQLEAALLSGKRLRIYGGFDPSAPSLHVGNAILINKLSQFQALGHEIIFLIGDFTGMIGDPTDKKAARKKLTRKEVLANAKNYQKQASAYLDFRGKNPAKVMYNSSWHDKVGFKDLIELASNFTVQQMIIRDMFQERLKEEKPIYLHEFLYPLAQAYDSVAMDVDLEIGGNDQMFNMMCGRDLMKAMGKKDKAVLLTNILADGEGNKMGKTSGNALFLDTDANNMYGIIMSWPDEVIIPAFELVTKKPLTEIKALAKDLSSGKLNPRDAKMALALDITTLVHGEKSALEAADRFKQTVQKKEAPAKIETIKIGKEDNLLSATVQYFGTAKSKSDIRRLFDQNAIEVNGEKIKDFNQLAKTGDIIKAGKKDWFKIS